MSRVCRIKEFVGLGFVISCVCDSLISPLKLPFNCSDLRILGPKHLSIIKCFPRAFFAASGLFDVVTASPQGGIDAALFCFGARIRVPGFSTSTSWISLFYKNQVIVHYIISIFVSLIELEIL